ncbi:hypothetical protein ACFPIJ_42170 [Dactylosporangium cerinum]|uniref:Uncharacterized protein n=1 Tax=Dactylosporangium cerinum TaxID=1434730 RepID=A0ABV9W6W4_9ACTN
MTNHHTSGAHVEVRGGHPPGLRAAVTASLARVEARLDRHGWDQPPALIGIFHHPRPYPTRTVTSITTLTSTVDTAADLVVEVDAGLVAPATWHRPHPTNPAVNLHPVDVLLGLPAELTGPAMRDWLRDWLHHDGRRLVGFGFCFEAWQGMIRPGYRHGDLAAAPATQRTEVRAVAALDTAGHAWQLIRRRDATRPAITTSDSTGQHIAASRVLTALRRLNQLGHSR